ncbi:MAG: hypothetical protein PHU53_07770, partial [Thermoplasmata archaeon]|nr:hypothetical protein [Thermoplasmata archaeon]
DHIDVIAQLRAINDHILDELNRCRRLIDREDEMVRQREVVEDQVRHDPTNTALVKKLKQMAGDNIAGILKLQSNLISISGEVRKQLEFQVKIFETIYNVHMVTEFQQEILDVLKGVDPNVRNMVIARLKERRSLRGLVKIN